MREFKIKLNTHMEKHKIITKAKYYINANKYAIAARLLLKILKTSPNDPYILFELGKIYFLLGNYNLSEKYLIKTLKNKELLIYASDFLIKIYKTTKKINKSVYFIKQTLKMNKKSYEIYKELLNIYFYDIKNLKESYILSKRMVSHFKKDIFAYRILIKSAIHLKKYSCIKKYGEFILKNKHLLSYYVDEILRFAEELCRENKYLQAFKLVNFIAENQKEKTTGFFKKIQYDFAIFLKNNKYCAEKLLNYIPEKNLKIRNIALNEFEIKNKKIILQSMPRAITVVLTNRCNLKCCMCQVWKNNWDLPKQAVEQVKMIMPYLEYVTWHGGEVLLHKDFESLFECAVKNNVKQEIITNGLLINKNMIDKFIKNNIQLTLSIDSTKKELYERIRSGARFENIKAVLRSLKNRRKKYEKSSIKIRMNVIISENNFLEVFDFINFAHKYDMHEIYFFMLNNFDFKCKTDIDRFIKNYKKIIKYFTKNEKAINDMAKKFGINIVNAIPGLKAFKKIVDNVQDNDLYEKTFQYKTCSMDNSEKKLIVYDKKSNTKVGMTRIKCTVPWQRLRIDEYIRPHCFCRDDANVGVIDGYFNIFTLWNSEYMQSYRNMILCNDLHISCNPVCYSGIIPKNQCIGVV